MISALDCLFTTLKEHGRNFTPEFWKTVCDQILFPIFAILKHGDQRTQEPEAVNGNGHDSSINGNPSSSSPAARFKSPEDMSVWLSTTLISALREVVDLYSAYFAVMKRYLDGLLDILVACICQGEWRLKYCHLSRSLVLTLRKRHACSYRDFMLPAAARVECQKDGS